jgi:1-acyl-sn-glycerol-3-phosphate acyltransferase
MPPPAIRRPLTVTAWLLMSAIALIVSPALLVLAAVLSALLRRPQPMLSARLLIAYFRLELGALAACGLLWLASGFGAAIRSRRFQLLHYRLLRWFVHGLAQSALTILDIDVSSELGEGVPELLKADTPFLFFSRHAGPGDTVLLVDLLTSRYGRFPSVVFKDTLAIDPSVDLIGHRLPHAVLDTSDSEQAEERIEVVSAGLGPRGVLVLFPEGGNFTPVRRRRALRKLRRKGLLREAAAGESMSHVMPPHPSGALAALRANPDADVVFGAHTGLGLAAFPGELWRHTPIGATFTARMWRAAAADRPLDPDRQVDWLYDWWKRIDRWIADQGEGERAIRSRVE